MTTHIYVSESAPAYRLRVEAKFKLPQNRVQFYNGRFETENDELAEFLDNLISTRPDISTIIRKLDREMAESIVAAHQEKRRRENAGVTGPFTSGALDQLKTEHGLQERDAQGRNLQVNPETLSQHEKEIYAGAFSPTVTGQQPVSTPNDGFIPDAQTTPSEEGTAENSKSATTKFKIGK